jgi:ankyrin
MNTNNQERLFQALEDGDIERAKLIVEQGVDINSIHRGESLLNFVLTTQQYPLVPFLLARGADPNQGSPVSQLKPIHLAVESEKPDLVLSFIEANADLDAKTSDGVGLLEYCLQHNGHPAVARTIVEANKRQKGIKWRVPTETIKQYRNPMVKSYLLLKARTIYRPDRGMELDPELPGELDLLIEWNQRETLDFLFHEGLPIDHLFNDQSTLLSKAINAKNSLMVKYLLDAGADPNQSAGQELPLEMAFKRGNRVIASQLVRTGAIIENFPGGSFLAKLIQSRHEPLVNFVLSSKKPLPLGLIKITSEQTTTPLHEAAKWGKLNIVQNLVAQGARTDIRDSQRKVPLVYAIEEGHQEIVELLFSPDQITVSPDKQTPLHVAARANQEEMLSWFLEHRLSPEVFNIYGNPPIRGAIINGNLAMCKQLDFPGMTLHANKTGNTALHWAAESGQLEVVEWLVEKGSPIEALNNKRQTPILLSLKNGHLDIFDYLYEKDASLEQSDTAGNSILKIAIQQDHSIEIIKAIVEQLREIRLDEVFEVLAKDDSEIAKIVFELPLEEIDPGLLPRLIRGIFSKQKREFFGILRTITDRTVSVQFREQDKPEKGTILMFAVRRRHLPLVEWLISEGTDLDVVDTPDGYTALIVAVKRDYDREAELLITGGANLNIQSKKGDTALHWAAAAGNLTLAKCLVENGADANLISNYGLNALEVAIKRQKTEVAKYLREIVTRIPPTDTTDHPLSWTREQDCLGSSLVNRLSWNKLMKSLKATDHKELCDQLVEMNEKEMGAEVRRRMVTDLTDQEWICQMCGEHLMDEGHDGIAFDQCHHFFHQDCIDEHLEDNDSCPISGQKYQEEKWSIKRVEKRVDCGL